MSRYIGNVDTVAEQLDGVDTAISMLALHSSSTCWIAVL